MLQLKDRNFGAGLCYNTNLFNHSLSSATSTFCFTTICGTVHRGNLRGKKLALGTTILSAFLYT